MRAQHGAPPSITSGAATRMRAVQRAEKAGRRGAQVVATMLTCPHLVRQETVHADSAGYAAARDAWAVTVVLHFLLYGRWPFSQAQMQRWAAGGKWEDDARIDYSGAAPRLASSCSPEMVAAGGGWLWSTLRDSSAAAGQSS